MKEPGLPANEALRLERLRAFNILDTDPEAGFDDLVRVAAGIFDVPISLVSLVDEGRQWFKARLGLEAPETPRSISFCGHAVESGASLVVPDATADRRFHDNPLVTSDPNIAFYAGAPLTTDDGATLGTLCVIDHKPHAPSAQQIEALEALGRQVVNLMELRLRVQDSDRIIEQERRTRRRIESQANCLQLLQDISAQVDHPLDERLTAMLRVGVEAVDLGLGLVGRVRGDELVAGSCLSLADNDPGDVPAAEICAALWAGLDGRVANVSLTALNEGNPLRRRFGITALLAVPLVIEGEVSGLLALASVSADKRSFSPTDHTLANLTANAIAAEINRERVLRAIREEALRKRVHSQLGPAASGRFFSAANDLLVVAGFDGYFKELNPAAERVLGFSAEELMSRPVFSFIHPDDRQRSLAIVDATMAGEHTMIENRFVQADGSHRWLSWSFAADLAHERIYGIAQDISERKRVEQMKNEFVSTVSHELRTPLTSIRGSLGLLLGGAVGEIDGESRPLLQMACDNTDRLVRLINDMLDIDKIESGKLQIERVPVDLVAVAHGSVQANASFAAKHGVKYAITDAPAEAWVRGDADRLTQAMDNLLSNAAKYAPDSGQVDVVIEPVDGAWRVQVADQGPGIPEDFRARLFQRFSQADSSTAKQAGGTGLGLSITRSIIKLLDGRIGVESEPGQGATFWFTLPQMRHAATELPARQPSAAGDERKVLIVEDEPDIAHLLQMMLDRRNLPSDVARSAAEAEAMLAQRAYAAVSLDLALPDESGIDFFRRMRRKLGAEMPPVIVVSANVETGRAELNGHALGIMDWISKPIDEDELMRAVNLARLSGGEKVRVLHLEDDPNVIEITSRQIQSVADVTPALTIAEAQRALAELRFDLAIVDLTLPDGDGAEVIEQIKASEDPIPVIIYSGAELDASVSDLATAVLVKTRHDERDLLQTIGRLVDRITDVADTN